MPVVDSSSLVDSNRLWQALFELKGKQDSIIMGNGSANNGSSGVTNIEMDTELCPFPYGVT